MFADRTHARPSAPPPFDRGLSDAFMRWLRTGTGRALLDLFRDDALDIRLGDDSFHVYEAQCSLASVAWKRGGRCRLSVRRAYLGQTRLQPSAHVGEYDYFPVTDSFVTDYAALLPALRRTAADRHGTEGQLEAQCLSDNRVGTPLLAFDRQVVLPGGTDRIDVLAVSADRSRPLLVAVELKRGLNRDIETVAAQTLMHMKTLDPDGIGLRHDIAVAYRRVCDQLRALGRHAPDPALIKPGMPVVGLAALAESRAEPRLLARGRSDAKTATRSIGLCHLDTAHLVLPDPAAWIWAATSADETRPTS